MSHFCQLAHAFLGALEPPTDSPLPFLVQSAPESEPKPKQQKKKKQKKRKAEVVVEEEGASLLDALHDDALDDAAFLRLLSEDTLEEADESYAARKVSVCC